MTIETKADIAAKQSENINGKSDPDSNPETLDTITYQVVHQLTNLPVEIEVSPYESEEEARKALMNLHQNQANFRVMLNEFHIRQGYKLLGYRTVEECADAEFGFTRSRYYQIIKAADTHISLSKILDKLAISNLNQLAESALVELSKVDEEAEQIYCLNLAVHNSKLGRPTAKNVKEAVAYLKTTNKAESIVNRLKKKKVVHININQFDPYAIVSVDKEYQKDNVRQANILSRAQEKHRDGDKKITEQMIKLVIDEMTTQKIQTALDPGKEKPPIPPSVLKELLPIKGRAGWKTAYEKAKKLAGDGDVTPELAKQAVEEYQKNKLTADGEDSAPEESNEETPTQSDDNGSEPEDSQTGTTTKPASPTSSSPQSEGSSTESVQTEVKPPKAQSTPTVTKSDSGTVVAKKTLTQEVTSHQETDGIVPAEFAQLAIEKFDHEGLLEIIKILQTALNKSPP